MIKLISLADLITLTNAVFGFLAILFALTGELWLAAIFIFLGLLADGLDGYVARYLGTGKIGEYLESLADMLSLSIAPLLLLYMTFKDTVAFEWRILFVVLLLVSLVCSLIRLSSFSLLKSSLFFQGLPTSASAILLVIVSLLRINLLIVTPVVIVLALAMISPIRFPKPGVSMNLVTAVLILAVIVLDGMYNNIALYVLLIMLMVYIFAGPISLRLGKKIR